MRKLRSSLLFILLLLSTAGFAQVTLSVTIDNEKADLIEGVEIIIDLPTKAFSEIKTTNKHGSVTFNLTDTGEYVITTFIEGYENRIVTKHLHTGLNKLSITIIPLNVELDPTTIYGGEKKTNGKTWLNGVEGTSIYKAKKNEVVVLKDIDANLASNNSRQVFSKVTGLNIWENDEAGLQIGVGGRGLSPNRTSNFNTRQNGYDMSADALGYPESYYSPPMQSLERIEVIRGAASLQYGTQFGGVINFKIKEGSRDTAAEITANQTLGSYGFYNSYNSVGGTIGKFNYYTFHQYREGKGWRQNSPFSHNTYYAGVNYQANRRLVIGAQYTNMSYLAQQPGGLTDALFNEDAQQSIRDRNWFRVRWNLFALTFDYNISDKTKLNIRNFGLIAERSALGFLGVITRADPLEERNLIQGEYENYGSEARLITRYYVGKIYTTALYGARYYHGSSTGKQGLADDGVGPNFKYLNPDNLENSDYAYPSKNIALFTEQIFNITNKFSITPGVRYEYIKTGADGYYRNVITDLAGNIIKDETFNENSRRSREVYLAGLGLSYKVIEKYELYANFSQNYRAINFTDLRVVNPNLVIDQKLADEKGYNADLGLRGKKGNVFNYDVSLFYLRYNGRIGEVLRNDTITFRPYRYRTNIADSRNYGIEAFAELDVWKLLKGDSVKSSIITFANATLLDARYINSDEAAINNKQVESVPKTIFRGGITYKNNGFSATCQYSYTAEQFSDATNSEFSSTAVNGIIPAYSVIDLSAGYRFKRYKLSSGINNLADARYFTRRAAGYPGPGIIPSSGRTWYISLNATF